MARKIFISFLGSSNYGTCIYVKEDYKSNSVRYIQKATLELIDAKKWESNDKAVVLVTRGERGSFQKNWLDDGQIKYGSNEVILQPGLKTQLGKIGLPFNVQDVHIKDGNSEEEIWEIFETIYDLLNEEDEVYLDITHGFRYLPMLSIVLSNYGKLLKNITIKSITYGNYESRKGDEAPIIDLTSFSELQDWTNATQSLLKSGRVDDIIDLLGEKKGIDKLTDFSNDIIANRGIDIYKGNKVSELKIQLKKFNPNIAPFKEIKGLINKKLKPFKQSNVDNGFRAVEFCIEHSLYQQGITLLQEFIITKLMFESGLTKIENIKSYQARNVFKVALQKKCKNNIKVGRFLRPADEKSEGKKEKTLKKINKWVDDVFEFSFKEDLTSKVFIELSDKIRNDINHAGFRQEPLKAEEFEAFLKEKYKIVKQLFGIK